MKNNHKRYKVPYFKSNFLIFLFVVTLFNFVELSASKTIDTVFQFTPGKGQNAGQSTNYFPKNIFGIPSRIASNDIAEMDEKEVLSLGLNGNITVGIKDYVIVDQEGIDFTIFENVFQNPLNDKFFIEPAKIYLSQDGINFVEYPNDLNSLEGCAGTKATYGNKDWENPQISGGNSFDLNQVGMKWIKYIKIQDTTQFLLSNPQHPNYDAVLSGFDLDAVVCHNVIQEKEIANLDVDFQEFNNSSEYFSYNFYNQIGQLIKTSNSMDIIGLSSGLYFVLQYPNSYDQHSTSYNSKNLYHTLKLYVP